MALTAYARAEIDERRSSPASRITPRSRSTLRSWSRRREPGRPLRLMKLAVTVVAPPGYPHAAAFVEVAETLHAALTALGHDSLLTTEGRLPGRRHIVLGANLLPGYPLPLGEDAILYNLEQVQLGSSWFRPELLELFRRYTLWDYSRRNLDALAALGVEVARLVPIGYVPELTRIEPARDPDLDARFMANRAARDKYIGQPIRPRPC